MRVSPAPMPVPWGPTAARPVLTTVRPVPVCPSWSAAQPPHFSYGGGTAGAWSQPCPHQEPRVKTQETPYSCPNVQPHQEAGLLGGRPLASPPGTVGEWGATPLRLGMPPSSGLGRTVVHSSGGGLETELPTLPPCLGRLVPPTSWAAPRCRSRKFPCQLPRVTCVLSLGSPQGEGDSPDPASGSQPAAASAPVLRPRSDGTCKPTEAPPPARHPFPDSRAAVVG